MTPLPVKDLRYIMAPKRSEVSKFDWQKCRQAVSVRYGDELPASAKMRLVLMEAIRIGVLTPGTRLKEAELGHALSVSRTPLREALTALKSEHVITTEADGMRVRTLGWRDITDLYELRATLEGMAGRLAAEKASPSEKAVLQDLCEDEAKMISRGASPEELAKHNAIFHESILYVARNQFLIESLERLSQMLVLLGATSYSLPSRVADIQEEHHTINVAIQVGDGKACEAAMIRHLLAALKARLKLSSLSFNSEMD